MFHKFLFVDAAKLLIIGQKRATFNSYLMLFSDMQALNPKKCLKEEAFCCLPHRQ